MRGLESPTVRDYLNRLQGQRFREWAEHKPDVLPPPGENATAEELRTYFSEIECYKRDLLREEQKAFDEAFDNIKFEWAVI